MKISKAVFPVAGFGTRFLPATEAMSKKLMPIGDKALIQYVAEEAIAAGIYTLIFVTGRNKRAIEDHFDANNDLEIILRARGKVLQADMYGLSFLMDWNAYLCVRLNSWVWATRFYVRKELLAGIRLLFCWRTIF